MNAKSLYIILLLSALAWGNASGQAVQEIAPTPMCWTVGGVDSSLVRYLLLSSRTPTQVQLMVYRNAAGQNVTVAGGVLNYGACACCTRDTLPIPRAENYSEIVPQPNPMDPGSLTVCYRGQSAYLYGITDPTTQIVVEADGVPLTYVGSALPAVGEWSYDPTNKFFRALSPNYGTGSGPHTIFFTVTIPAGTLTRTINWDCGS